MILPFAISSASATKVSKMHSDIFKSHLVIPKPFLA